MTLGLASERSRKDAMILAPISTQSSKTCLEYYQALLDDSNGSATLVGLASKMVELLGGLVQVKHSPMYGFTSHLDLNLLSQDTYLPQFVRLVVRPTPEGYEIEYQVEPALAAWSLARVVGRTTRVDMAIGLICEAIRRTKWLETPTYPEVAANALRSPVELSTDRRLTKVYCTVTSRRDHDFTCEDHFGTEYRVPLARRSGIRSPADVRPGVRLKIYRRQGEADFRYRFVGG